MKINKLIVVLSALVILVAVPSSRAADNPALMEPVKSVYANYLKIQQSLAKDSLTGVSESAGLMAKSIRGDEMKMLPLEVAKQADTLAGANDLKAARQAFKSLSDSLIKYLADHKVQSGSYHEVYCPMADASWLQGSKQVNNPYLGKEMPACGDLKRQF
jgi:Protein of unknown function (DUF3347)